MVKTCAEKDASMLNLTFNMLAPVGFLWEKTPEVCNARYCNRQKLLYNNQGLLLGENLIRQKLSVLQE